jgi:hypothetical protein
MGEKYVELAYILPISENSGILKRMVSQPTISQSQSSFYLILPYPLSSGAPTDVIPVFHLGFGLFIKQE